MSPDSNTLLALTLFAISMQGLLIGAMLLFLKGNNQTSNRLLAAIVFIESARLVLWFMGLMRFNVPTILYSLMTLQLLIPVAVYFYICSLTNEHFTLKKQHGWHLFPFLVLTFISFILWPYHVFIKGGTSF